MAYLLIPNSNDKLKVSQSQIKTNFTEIQTSFDVNHEDFDAANTGMHKFIQFTQQASDPDTTGSLVALFSKLNSISMESELYFKRQGNGTVKPITLSKGATLGGDDGFLYLAGGSLALKWNIVNNGGSPNNSDIITFSVGNGRPVFSDIPVTFTQNTDTPSTGGTAQLYSVSTNTATTTNFISYSRVATQNGADDVNITPARAHFIWYALGFVV